ncbi:ABC transporter family protein [Trichomonas vaginalis G3]|uniref:ABC transporter family protein n=1 Tax=Trichomonas vaginalis (strain ATCC PRA-98 / G3) TaxID=412133 RepID=A2FZA1_TRIV3|nr:ABC transporter B family [Trichomonas vaginalis G3]EAX89770.1 ABC transporter family protein [Trichomonas vaginalis G3]KAI5492234.1 ABC transporter B family [Trichomonas vaginalis G3]|eukprot:XP_001302700.1 ABC transporter family protein [Trichomonas vaginalis G3]
MNEVSKDQMEQTSDTNPSEISAGKKEKPGMKHFLKVLKFYPKRWVYFIALLFSFINGIVAIVFNVVIGNITTELTTSNDFMKAIKKNIYTFLIIMGIFAILWLIGQLCVSYAAPGFHINVRILLLSKLLSFDIDYFDQNQSGSLLDRITTDSSLIYSIYMDRLCVLTIDLSQALAGFVLSFIYSWRISLIALFVIPICFAAFFLCEYFIGKLWHDYNNATNAANTKAEEVINSFRTVKSFDRELTESEKYESSLQKILNVVNKTSVITGIKDGILNLFVNVLTVVFLYFCVWIIKNKPSWNMKSGDVMVLMSSLLFSIQAIFQALILFEDFRKANVASQRLLEILEHQPKINQKEGENPELIVKGKVEFKNVSFRYLSKDTYAVKNLSFTINPGETVAFVGESGCGKSTTLQLLQRFYEIESGEILVDDINITTWSPHYLRTQISIVPQTPVMFSMSIEDNIKYADPDIDKKNIYEAAKIGNAHNFIIGLPSRYNTIVQQTSLSGGPKQRICIARAVLQNSPILLLDEATAALDTESEKLVQQSLEEIRKGKTAIIVAHRLATVINADKIFVFKDGHIVEAGKHEELLSKGGYYADLIKYQLQQ